MGELIIAFLVLCGNMGNDYDLSSLVIPATHNCHDGWMNNGSFQSFLVTGDYEALPSNLKKKLDGHIAANAAVYQSVADFLAATSRANDNSGEIIFIDDTAE